MSDNLFTIREFTGKQGLSTLYMIHVLNKLGVRREEKVHLEHFLRYSGKSNSRLLKCFQKAYLVEEERSGITKLFNLVKEGI